MYNGLAAAAGGSAPGAALFFSVYETSKNALVRRTDERWHSACYMGASSLGEIGACLVRVPTENVKQKMQAGLFKTTGECMRNILKEQGAGGFYVGYFTTVAREIPFSFIQFPIYEGLKKYFNTHENPVASSLCGSFAGGFSAAVTTPLDVIKVPFTDVTVVGCRLQA